MKAFGMDFDGPLKVEQLTLDRWDIAIRRIIAREFAESCKGEIELRAFEGHMLRDVVLELRAYLTAKIHGPEVLETKTISYPLDWWQAFREAWFPKWWLRRWPVKRTVDTIVMKTQTVKICPHLATDKMTRHLNYLAGDQRQDALMEQEEIWKLKSFVHQLCARHSELGWQASPLIQEEAKKVLGITA